MCVYAFTLQAENWGRPLGGTDSLLAKHDGGFSFAVMMAAWCAALRALIERGRVQDESRGQCKPRLAAVGTNGDQERTLVTAVTAIKMAHREGL
ncbi:MAG: hypothetical protein ACOVQM_18500 [Pirellula sp.]